jgi:hypothetical protein
MKIYPSHQREREKKREKKEERDTEDDMMIKRIGSDSCKTYNLKIKYFVQ